MRQALAATAAQLSAETRIRFRSLGTIVTILILFAIGFLYLPDPDANRVSIMWHSEGANYSGTYSTGFIGAVMAMLTAMILPLAGFYLVTGSVTRDQRRRVWPIIAATRTSTAAYLGGKWVASVAYLLLLASVSLIPAAILFFRYGTGPFAVDQLLLPWLLMVPPAMAFTAAMALLFDCTPVLRGRAGWVIWFFVWTFGFIALPASLGNIMDNDPANDRVPSFDPSGAVFFEDLLKRSIDTPITGTSLGIIVIDKPLLRVPFPELRIEPVLLLRRLMALAWSAVPLVLAGWIFHWTRNWSPRGSKPPKKKPVIDQGWSEGGSLTGSSQPLPTHPSYLRSVGAELRMMWKSASWIRWPMLASGMLFLLVPESSARGFLALFLILLVPLIAESAAREQLSGTTATVFSQPGLPRSVVAWKLSAVASFIVLVSLPVILRACLDEPLQGLTIVLALTFIATASVGLGWLSGGGKFFVGIFVVLWYLAIQKDSPLDFTGVMASTNLGLSAGFAAGGAVLVLAAAAREYVLQARG